MKMDGRKKDADAVRVFLHLPALGFTVPSHFSPLIPFMRLFLVLLGLICSSASGWAVDVKDWNPIGRVDPKIGKDSVTIQDGFLAGKESWGDCELSFRARAPEDVGQVQIWAGLRGRDRDSRYIFGLRGGDNNDVYLARYAPDGDDKFLGVAPLDFKPAPGTWYKLRAVVRGNRFLVYVNDETLPRINVVDDAPLWKEGGVSLGGGWLPVEFRDVAVREVPATEAVETQVRQAPGIDRQARRLEERAAYRPLKIERLEPGRTEISLNGKWLFEPDQELTNGPQPLASDYDDTGWHVMDVPDFWTPCLSWLYGETGFKLGDGVASSKGISDHLFEAEQKRLDGYTFDWKKTKSAWYRHYVELPADMAGRQVQLHFDAVAKVSEVWVNGQSVGSHTGMFGELACDITKAVRPGKNVIAVHVVGIPEKHGDNKVVGVAVTVEVTSAMLNSLPHGMFKDDASGIWQPVKLVVTAPVAVNDIYIRPKVDGADFDIEVRNGGTETNKVQVGYVIKSAGDGAVLDASTRDEDLTVPPGGVQTLTLSTPKLSPRLWTPASPNLYHLEVKVSANGHPVDLLSTPFGFRTFVTDKARFLLNGKPFWLLGANHFPSALRPNDAELAHKFIELAREGNVRVTRSHTVPMTETWLQAADELGMGVSFEGTWPWLMLNGPPPDPKLLKVWKDEFAALVRKYRNHPSVLIWTVNNEMKFPIFDKDDPALLKKKWAIVDDMIKTIRRIDPTRPIVADSSYTRKGVGKEYEDFIKPNGIDDGDIDDCHAYFGWYEPSFFHFFKGEFGTRAWPDRPLISQEMSTGYPRSDDGHPTRAYLFNHHTPQALSGDEAYENRDPALFLRQQNFMTKELAETFRRADRNDCAGILHFAYLSWFKDVWNAKTIAPLATYHGMQKALQPVLVSAELYGRHFYAGTTVQRRICLANDANDFQDLPAGQVTWEIQHEGKALAQGSLASPAVAYYSNQWLNVAFKFPDLLPAPRINAQLVLKLEAGGKVVSQNSYDMVVATPEWARGGLSASGKKMLVFDPAHQSDKALEGLGVINLTSLEELKDGGTETLVLGDAAKTLANAQAAARVKAFVESGGQLLLLNPGAQLPLFLPDQISGYRATKSGEVATMHIAESNVFAGLEPLDMAWFELGSPKLPLACRGVYTINRTRPEVEALADHCDIHAYLKKKSDIIALTGSPLVRIRLGKGTILASEMALDAAPNDPIARRLVFNLVGSLQEQKLP